MSSRLLASVLIASLLVLGLVSVALSRSAFAVDDLWYPGEGVKKDMFVEYEIRTLDTADGDPFIMTMWFKEQQDGNWIVPTAIQHDNDVFTGNLKLTDAMYPLAGGDELPSGMNDFV